MASPLFRPESLEAKRAGLNGVVTLRQPLSHQLLVVASVLAVLAILLFLSFGEYTRRQTASGHVVPTAGVVKLYPRQAGVLEKLEVAEGDIVEAGQVLARFSNRREQDGQHDIDSQLAQQLRASASQLDEKIAEETHLASLEADRVGRQIAGIQADLVHLQTQLATANERLALAESRKSAFERLQQQGHVSEAQSKDLQQAWLDARLRREEAVRALTAQQAQLADLRLQQEQLPGRQASRLADLHNQASELRQRLIEVESRREFAVVAPVAGRATAIQIKQGQTATTQIPLLSVIPTGAEFEAELFVPTRAVGFIQPGQQVFVRYQAFPYQRYGLYEGRVKHLANVILSPQEIPAPVPAANEPVYRVTITLARQDVAAYGKRLPIQPGMLLDADIVLDRRPIWQWLLEPVFSLKGRL